VNVFPNVKVACEWLVSPACKQLGYTRWVAQRYIEDPLLFEGRKFHARLFVLTDGHANVLVFNEGRCVLAADEYKAARGKFTTAPLHGVGAASANPSFAVHSF
jgi:hypothetical protein